MSRCFKSGQKKEETLSPLFDNGRMLLKELISTFNGRQEIPIRCFTAEELISATDNFSDELRKSGFIYRGLMNERQVLVKKSIFERIYTRVDCLSSVETNETIRDIAITSQMSPLKNVLKLSGCCLEFRPPALVYEYIEFERLDDLLYHNENPLTWKNRIQIAIGIANVILYLHTAFQTPVIYRGLCPSKVIIDQHGIAKLTDFSLSISLPCGESQVQLDVIQKTFGFMDPAYMTSGIVSQKTDVFSFGVILLVLVTGQKSVCTNFEGEMIYIVEYVTNHFENDQLTQILDPKIVNQGFDQKQLQAILELGMRCTRERDEDRPEMIDIARKLRQIAKSDNYSDFAL